MPGKYLPTTEYETETSPSTQEQHLTYPQQFPQQPQFPAQFPQQPQYAPPAVPQQYPAAPPQQYAAPVAPVPQGPAPVQGTLTGFFSQPSVGGGPSWSFKDKPIGTQYAGIVERAINNGDIEQSTKMGTNEPDFYRDGRPKLKMAVPMLVAPDVTFPDGKARWIVQGSARDELVRAMAATGVSAEQIEKGPEAGAAIRVTLTNRVPTNFGNPRNVFHVEYVRPDGAAPAPAPVAQEVPAQPVQAAPVAQPQPVQAPAPVAAPAPVQPVAPAAPVAQAAPLAVPEGMSPEKAALLARLTGGQQAA